MADWAKIWDRYIVYDFCEGKAFPLRRKEVKRMVCECDDYLFVLRGKFGEIFRRGPDEMGIYIYRDKSVEGLDDMLLGLPGTVRLGDLPDSFTSSWENLDKCSELLQIPKKPKKRRRRTPKMEVEFLQRGKGR